MMKKKYNFMGDMVKTGVGNIVGVGMIGATSEIVNKLPAGSTERTIAGIVPGLQSTALVGHNLKMVNKSFGTPMKRRMIKRRRLKL